MEIIKEKKIHGRVRQNTSEQINRKIDRNILENIRKYKDYSDDKIAMRLEELCKEWDIERTLEVNASILALTGVILGAFVHRRWNFMSAFVLSFLMVHGLQGWCPPLPLFRSLGIRTRREIDEEVYALKIIRGDFRRASSRLQPEDMLKILRKKK